MQQSLDSHIKAPHHSNPSTPSLCATLLTPIQDQVTRSHKHLWRRWTRAAVGCAKSSKAPACGPAPPSGAAQRFQTVLATAGIVALADAGFASRMDDMMVNSIRKFTAVKKRADDLAVLLQPARPGSSLPATLIGLHGDELFQALVALQVPEVATKNVHLEAALAAQRLAMQETVDLHIHVYEEIVYIGHYKASEDRKTLAFFQRLESLDAIVQKHVDLATKAAAT